MNPTLLAMLVALVLFQAKHFLCDFVFQTLSQVQSKGIYGHFGGVGHAGLHALGSLPALLVLTRSPLAIAVVVAIEFALHYHIDWTKARVDASQGLTIADRKYWVVFGLDQLLHQLTYVGIVYVLAA
jgi:hypothetical protein